MFSPRLKCVFLTCRGRSRTGKDLWRRRLLLCPHAFPLKCTRHPTVGIRLKIYENSRHTFMSLCFQWKIAADGNKSITNSLKWVYSCGTAALSTANKNVFPHGHGRKKWLAAFLNSSCPFWMAFNRSSNVSGAEMKIKFILPAAGSSAWPFCGRNA